MNKGVRAMPQEFKVALAQFKAIPNDVETNLKKGIEICKEAKQKKADIVLFPEMWSIGCAEPFAGASDNPYVHGKETVIKSWYNQAVDAKSEYIQEFVKLAKELKLAIAITYLEKYNPTPRNTISIIDSKGNIVLTYAKVHTCDFSMERLLTDGDEFKTCELKYEGGKVKLGAMICYDREHPESARILMLHGAEIILVPNACEMTSFRLNQLYSRAYENMLGIAMTNYPGEKEGISIACSPIVCDQNRDDINNYVIAKANRNEELVMAAFNLDEIKRFRETEIWGNAFRKPHAYKELLSYDVNEPFIRETDRRKR